MFENELDKIRLQKLLFLFCKRQIKAEYDFIPFKFGCFSFSANADLTAMVNKGLLTESESSFKKNDKIDYAKILKQSDQKIIDEIKLAYGNMGTDTLVKHTYVNFPYWAINSLKAESMLTADQFKNVGKSRPSSDEVILFTIGYEGISLEEYLNRLLKNDINVLLDVRNNPISMKYGFSKNQLKRFCESLGITYLHFPEVGIQSGERKELITQADYDKLFINYCKDNLTQTLTAQISILNLLKQYKRIALTCFEANICQCHRKHLAEAIQRLPDFAYPIKHI